MDKNSQAYTDIYALQNGETTACIVKADANKLFLFIACTIAFKLMRGRFVYVWKESTIT